MNDDEIVIWLKLSMIFGIGSAKLFKCFEHYTSAEGLVHGVMYKQLDCITDEESILAKKISYNEMYDILSLCKERGINYYCYESEGYPQRLKQLANPPAMLYSLGNLDFLNDDINLLQFVGSRHPTDYTKSVVPKLIKPLAKLGFGFIDGYAKGVDKLSNDYAREYNARNAVFLAGAIDKSKDYPELKEISFGGAVISEFTPGRKTYTARPYVLRNRLMTCLADAVVICQEGEYGKGLNNVEFASSLNKRVFVVPPHDVFDKEYFGQRDLIRQGHTIVFNASDIVYWLTKDKNNSVDLSVLDVEEGYLYNPTLPPETANRKKRTRQEKLDPKIKEEEYAPTEPTEEQLSAMSDVQKRVVKELLNAPYNLAELEKLTGVSSIMLLNELTELEMKEIVRVDHAKRYLLK